MGAIIDAGIELPRSFRLPLMPIIPLVGIGFSVWLITKLDPATFLRFGAWFVLGIVLYAAYRYRHSLLGRGEVVHTRDV